jgi:hypothetical protein
MGIPERRAAAEDAIREAEGALEIARAGLRAVWMACRHPNATERHWKDYDGGGNTQWKCPDCGLEKNR